MSHGRILVRHIAPNVLSQALIYAMSDIVMDIMAIVTLGYLGLGIAPPTAEWGSMILDGQEFITTLWLQATIPASPSSSPASGSPSSATGSPTCSPRSGGDERTGSPRGGRAAAAACRT